MTSTTPETTRPPAILWNPERLPNGGDCIVVQVHQHSRHPLTQTLAYVSRPDSGGRVAFVASDDNPPIKFAFNQALALAEREGIGAIAIIDPVGFGWLELKDAV
ncbi:hypothetical protein GJ654_02300 [Rhodoblastus acidophilus]|uniref:Uncharacterized protein n=1 Tax=Rhodoblastus acidophilus TaxID=1074 RepID=A0A6N8DHF0_RHOAC|nr:hypothetical protein [Rhodoblastus acidophilus]MCW2272915.1 hypothetical protein [Rhodoblastus acidophilus]MTV29822.1 hypothetical protein [Rhodoblastus acidophilus]